MRLKDKLLREIERLRVIGLLDASTAGRLKESIEFDKAEFVVPRKIICNFIASQDYRFDQFWCPHCGELYRGPQPDFRCRRCGRDINQAYVFAAEFKFKPPASIDPSVALRPLIADRNAFCSRRHRFKRIECSNLERPIESLVWTCPFDDVSCPDASREGGRIFCTNDRYLRQRNPRVKVRFWTRSSPLPIRGLEAHYIPTIPSEGMTKAICASLHYFDRGSAENIAFSKELLPGVDRILFVRDLSVIQFSLCYAVGFPTAPLRKRGVSLNFAGESVQVVCRRMKTEGLVIKLRQDITRDIEDEERLNAMFHTLSHAFLRPLPALTGLDPTEFFESISPDDNEVAIFDNSPGGLGGISSLVPQGDLALNYQYMITQGRLCPLDCYSACRACLFVENCVWINRALRRDMLAFVVGGE